MKTNHNKFIAKSTGLSGLLIAGCGFDSQYGSLARTLHLGFSTSARLNGNTARTSDGNIDLNKFQNKQTQDGAKITEGITNLNTDQSKLIQEGNK